MDIKFIYRSVIYICISLLYVNQVIAQVTSVGGRFETAYGKGCVPFKVIIIEKDTFPPETVRQYDFNGDGVFVGFEPEEEVSYTYTDFGVYDIVQVINVDIDPKTDTLTVEVFPVIQPEFIILTCENHGARIDIEPDQYEQYRIFYTDTDSVTIDSGESPPSFNYSPGTYDITVKGLFQEGKDNCGLQTESFTTIENLVPGDLNALYLTQKDDQLGKISLEYNLPPGVVYYLDRASDNTAGFSRVNRLPPGSSSFTVDSIDNQNKIQFFRITAYDACQEKSVYSDTLGSVILTGEAENGQNRLTWESEPVGFGQFEVYRDGQLVSTILDQNLKLFVDKDVECFNEYCYNGISVDDNGKKSYSDTVCLEAFRIFYPPAIKNTTVSVSDKAIELSWTPPVNIDYSSFFIQRQVEGDIFATLDTVNEARYTDQNIDAGSGEYCYRISYLDECRNRSNLGDMACSVHLLIEDNKFLGWNDYRGWESGVDHYVVEIYNEQLELESEVDMGMGNSYEIEDYLRNQISYYRIRAASGDDPPLLAYSNFVIKQIESELWIPNAFTPGNDGLNDFFIVKGTLMKEFSLKIYTRSGYLVFETDDQTEGWDGTYDGKEMPFNTYIYRVEAVDETGITHDRTGKILLIRE